MTLYMAVTADEYELPIMVAKFQIELSRMLGIKAETIRTNFYRKRKKARNNMRFVKVEVDEDD